MLKYTTGGLESFSTGTLEGHVLFVLFRLGTIKNRHAVPACHSLGAVPLKTLACTRAGAHAGSSYHGNK